MAMDRKSPTERIKNLLQEEATQRRIQENIERTRLEARVTIGRASELFNVTEAKLREWDKVGLLRPVRSKDTTGQRQYSLAELSKLAVLRELVDAGLGTADIPINVDEIWREIERTGVQQAQEKRATIDHRVEEAYEQEFWRYYAAHVLELALTLVCEDALNSVAGLVLPLLQKEPAAVVLDSRLLPTLGPCLICWLTLNNTFHTFFEPIPSFEYISDFRVRGLVAVDEDEPEDPTYVVVQRKAPQIALSVPEVRIIRRLLAPLYEYAKDWSNYLGRGFRDVIHTMSRTDNFGQPDMFMNRLADMIVQLGGLTESSEPRWRFCTILVPDDLRKPFQLESLVVYAQSKLSPHTIGQTSISPESFNLSLSLRAFQSGRIAYRSTISSEDTVIEYRSLEEPIASAVAIPIGAETGTTDAVMYVTSAFSSAFTEEDQGLLRLMGRIIGELLKTYHVRQQTMMKLSDVVKKPELVDPLFSRFASENAFNRDIEELLSHILDRGPSFDIRDEVLYHTEEQDETREAVSFIAVDIDNQSDLANKYGDIPARNLIYALGQRIEEQLKVLFIPSADYRLYHIYSDRYYLMLNHVSLTQARQRAQDLQQAMCVPYKVIVHTLSEQITSSDMLIELPPVTVRLAVLSYPYAKLYQVMQRYDKKICIPRMRDDIQQYITAGLNEGQRRGGDQIISWYHPDSKYEKGRLRFAPWPPSSEE
jgi:DNA-binding transcriptional MerR regulator